MPPFRDAPARRDNERETGASLGLETGTVAAGVEVVGVTGVAETSGVEETDTFGVVKISGVEEAGTFGVVEISGVVVAGAAVFFVVRNGAGIVAVFHGELIQTMTDQSTGIGRG